jgi:molecular chaperone HtpG
MISLPSLFADVLSRNEQLHQSVRHTFNLFEPWLEQSGMPFFPGYTDHSPRHINDVLETAASLISDKSRPLLGPEDIAVLCISILLHDCGMHLTHDGFRALVLTPQEPVVSGLGDESWGTLWTQFLCETSRFNEEKLTAIFGSSEPYRIDLLDLDNLTERDCLLIGEFVRRHHCRLAHEVALNGVPGPPGRTPLRVIGMDHDFCDIAGLIARSHGMSVRQTFDYIETKYGLKAEYRGVKIPFLMTVLRIADYIQVQSERAITSLLSVKELRSPISKQEWRAHFAVSGVSTYHDDPEALYLLARPADVKTYIKLDALFKDIQRELDQSWATLGEVYGRLGDLADLGLNIRRIRSNFESREKFAHLVPYFPLAARFESSGPELLRLLIGPLYNGDCSIAIRESVQNAADACRELDDLVERGILSAPSNEPRVLVEIQESSDQTGWVTVTDSGIGMTLETVTQYFLVAGASFRDSDIWKRQHIDDSGSIRVMRGGRFGIGVLAFYLLGDEITVSTRHVTRAESIEFTARIDDSTVELRRGHSPVGTSIRVQVSSKDVLNALRPSFDNAVRTGDHTYTLLEWEAVDWFLHPRPKIVYRWIGALSEDDRSSVAEFVHLPQKIMPNASERFNSWQELADPGPYKAIYWRYARRTDSPPAADGLPAPVHNIAAVNGIRIGSRHDSYRLHGHIRDQSDADIPSYSVTRPSLSILDPAGVCPINLQRDDIAFELMGIDERLERAILRQYVRKVNRIAQSCNGLNGLLKLCRKIQNLSGVYFNTEIFTPFCCTQAGYTLASPTIFEAIGINKVFIVHHSDARTALELRHIQPDEALLLRDYPDKEGTFYLDWFRGFWSAVLGKPFYKKWTRLLEAGIPAAGWAMTHEKWTRVSAKGVVAAALREPLRSSRIDDNYAVISYGSAQEVRALTSRLEFFTSALSPKWEISAWCIGPEQYSLAKPSPLERTWRKLIGGPVLRR